MSDRADVVSSFTIIKGALIGETYDVFSGWDLSVSTDSNLRRLKETNFIGASSSNWLRDVAKVIHRRFDPDGRDRVLVELAQRACDRAVFDGEVAHIRRTPPLQRFAIKNTLPVRGFRLRQNIGVYSEQNQESGEAEGFHDSLFLHFRVFLFPAARLGFWLAVGSAKTGDGLFLGLKAFNQAQ